MQDENYSQKCINLSQANFARDPERFADWNKVRHDQTARVWTADSKQAISVKKSGYCSICSGFVSLLISCQDRMVTVAAD